MENNIQKVTITTVYTSNKDKQGNPLKSAKGYPYTRMSIKTKEHGDQWISGFQNKDNQNWKENDTVEVIIKKNGQYLNFETPKMEDKVGEHMAKVTLALSRIEAKVDYIANALNLRKDAIEQSQGPTEPGAIEYPEEEINAEDIPFN